MQSKPDFIGVLDFPLVSKLRWSARYNGLVLTIVGVLIRGLLRVHSIPSLNEWYKRNVSASFDKRFNVDTAGIVHSGDLDISTLQKQSASMYKGTDAITFGLVISSLGIEYSNFVFIDYGSGKGKALFLAAHFPFKRIIGVELSRALHLAAVENIGGIRLDSLRCRAISSICENAEQFQLPNDPLVIYLFHPFNKAVMSKVLEKIENSLISKKRTIKIVYQHPIKSDLYTEDLSEVIQNSSHLRKAKLPIKTAAWDVYESI